MCTEAYREALTRDLSARASSALKPALRLRPAAEANREGVAGQPLRRRPNRGPDDLEVRGVATAGAAADRAPAMAVAKEATVVNGKVRVQLTSSLQSGVPDSP
jgi:hypothetical protein